MNSDSCYHIGKSHPVCQDYARSGQNNENRSYAFVSDGCSSSPDTDIGARLLVLSAEDRIKRWDSEDINLTEVLYESVMMVPKSMSSHCLDATLLTLTESLDHDSIQVTVTGDGVIAALRRDGALMFASHDFPSGAPAYLSYKLDAEREKSFFRDPAWGIRKTLHVKPGAADREIVEDLRTEDDYAIAYILPKEEYRAVFAFTDGVHSFQKEVVRDGVTRVEAIPLIEVLTQLTAVKGFAGQFMQRRAQAFLQRFCKQNGWWHYDDLGCAAIDLGELP